MTRPDRLTLGAVGLGLALAVAAGTSPAAAAGSGAAVQVFPQTAVPLYQPDGLLFPGARPPQSRLLVPPPPGSPPVLEHPAPRKVEKPKTKAPKPAPAAAAVAATKPAPPEALAPEAVTAPEPAPKPAAVPPPEPAPIVAEPEPVVEPSPVQAAGPEPAAAPEPRPEPETEPAAAPAAAAKDDPPPLGPDVARQADVVARERLELDAPPSETGVMPPPVVPTDVAPPEPEVEVDGEDSALPPPSIDMLTVPFPPEAPEPAGDVSGQVRTLARLLEADPAARLRLNAYAPGEATEESKSRRLSLARALTLRGKLVDAGISSTRIEVRALGNKVPDGSADRVDVIVLER